MSSLPMLGRGDYEFVVIIIMVLVGIGTWIKEMLVRSAQRKRAGEKSGLPEPSVSTKISREIRKYLGEVPARNKPQEGPAAVHFRAPPSLPERLRPGPQSRPEPLEIPEKKKVPVVRRKAPRSARTPRGARLDRAGLRQAILYHEILGPPVSMRRKRPVTKLTRR
jgi:hypothetical protein